MSSQLAQQRTRPAGFSVVEVVVVLAILCGLAVWVVPRFSGAVTGEAQQTLAENLQLLRGEILIYRDQHDGIPPGVMLGATTPTPQVDTFVRQMTQYSNRLGQTAQTPSDEFAFGPYMQVIPVNPLAGNNDIRVVYGGAGEGSRARAAPVAQGPEGWVYDARTGHLAPNSPGKDFDGRAYIDY